MKLRSNVGVMPALVVAVLLAALLAGGCRSPQTTTGPQPCVIGAVLPLTGDAGTFGKNAYQGAVLAAEQASKPGTLPGCSVVVKAEDSRGTAQDAVLAMRKLIDVDKASVLIGDVTSAGTHAMLPLLAQSGVALVSPSASDPALSNASPLFARVWPSDVYEAAIISEYARSKKFSRMVVLYANTDYGLAMAREFSRQMGESVAFQIPINREAADYRPVIERVRLNKADAIFMVFYPEDAKRLLLQMQERRLSLPILATATFEDPALLPVPGADRVVFASPVPPSADAEVRRAFDAAYRTRFNEEPGVLSDTGYDAAALLIQGWATVGRPDGAAMMKWLRSVKDYAGASGKLSFLPSGDVVKEYRPRTVQEKKFAWLSAQ